MSERGVGALADEDGATDPAAIAALPTAVRDAGDAAERAGQRIRLGTVGEFDLVVLGPTDAGKTALVSALLSDAVGEFAGLAERPGRSTTTPVEYAYGSPAALWLGIGGTWAEPSEWVQVPTYTPDIAGIDDLRRVRAVAPAQVLRDWDLRIIDCPGFDGVEDLNGPIMEEASRPGVGVVYVVPRRGITEVDAQALESLRHVPAVLVENRRDAELAHSSADELAVTGLNTGMAVPIATRRLAEPGPERESLRRCVAMLRTQTSPARWTSTVHAAALRSRDALHAEFARRRTMALMARHPDWLGSLHVLADLLQIEREGPGLIDLTDRLSEIARLAEAAQPITSLRTLIDQDARAAVDRYNTEAGPARQLTDERTGQSQQFAQAYIEIRDDLIAILDNVLADAALRLTRTDVASIESTREGVLGDRLEIAVLGQCSSGKSSLVNALLGADALLPTSARPTTATVNQIEYSPRPSLAVTWLPQVDLRLLSPGAEPNQVRVHVDEIRALGRWLRGRSVLARDCVFHPLAASRGKIDGEAAFWRLWKMLDLDGDPQLYAYLAPSPDRPRLSDATVPAEVSVRKFATTPSRWPGKLSRSDAFTEISDDPALALRVDTLKLGFPHPLLKHVTIIDTPGTDAPIPHHRVTAHRAVRDKRQCAVVYCFDGAKPASREDRANLSFLRECNIGNTDLSRLFFAITRRGVAARDGDLVRETVRRTLSEAGAGSPRTYFTEVLAELNDEFKALSDDLDRYVLGTKGTVLQAWIAHARQVVEDVQGRFTRQLEDIAAGEQARQARVAALRTEADVLATLQTALTTSLTWGEPWLRSRIRAAVSGGVASVDDSIACLVSRDAFDHARADLGAVIEQLNDIARRTVESGCAQIASKLAVELSRRLPGRQISPVGPNLVDEFFSVADVDYAVSTVTWRNGWERVKSLLARLRRRGPSDVAFNRTCVAESWDASRDHGWQQVTLAVDDHLSQLQNELLRLADSIAAEIVAASRAPSHHDRLLASDGRDRAQTWLQRLDALSRTCSSGGSQ